MESVSRAEVTWSFAASACSVRRFVVVQLNERTKRFDSIDPFSFTSLTHSDNQSEATTMFYNSSKADVRENVLTLT